MRRGAFEAVEARWRRAVGAWLALLAAHGAAAAEPLRAPDDRGRVVDWTAGQLTARGLGVADRHAPSPAAARDAAKRRAIADAAGQLVGAAAQLPVAGGEQLGKLVTAVKLAELAAEATVASSEPLVDGSWRVELALPLEALRQAAAGVRQAPAAGDAASVPAVVIVRAPADVTPAIGVAIGDGKRSVRGATLWVKDSTAGVPLPEAALAQAPALIARRDGAGLRVAKLGGATDATLFVVVLGQ